MSIGVGGVLSIDPCNPLLRGGQREEIKTNRKDVGGKKVIYTYVVGEREEAKVSVSLCSSGEGKLGRFKEKWFE